MAEDLSIQNKASEMTNDNRKQGIKRQLLGWILFMACDVLFIVSSIRNRDVYSLVASILFLIGCVLFVVPLARAIMGGPTGEASE